MKSFVTLCLVVLAGFLPATASVHRASSASQNQFHFQPTGRRASQTAAQSAHFQQGHHNRKLREPVSKMSAQRAHSHAASGRKARRHQLNPPSGKLGFFAATQVPAGGGAYYGAVAGDFNGDGMLDIAGEVENWDSVNSVWVYSLSVVLSNGNGTFKPAVLTTLTDTCPALLAADVNGDGKTDLIVGHSPNNCGNTNTTIAFDVWLSKGDGTFTASTNTNNTIPVTNVAGGTVADVSGDGNADIVIVDDSNPANVWTLLGNGDGTFQPYTSVALNGQAGYNTVIADVNGDGLVDIVDNDYSTYQVTVYLAVKGGGYQNGVSYQTSDGLYNMCRWGRSAGLAVGDISGDGYPEIVNANCRDAGNDVTVYVNDGTGKFATGIYYNAAMSGGTNSGLASVYTESVAIADVNGDGFGDILAANDDSSDVTVLLGKSDGSVTVPTVGYATGGYPFMPLLVGDFTGNGYTDVVFPDDEFSFAYLMGYGDGTFRAALNYYAPTTANGSSFGMATGDFNKDGHPDFVIANDCWNCTTPMGITVFLSNPDGSLQPGINFGTAYYYAYVAVADFNGDGFLDIAATDPNDNLVQLFNGDGTGNFAVGSSFSADLAYNWPMGIYAADFNNDGFPDLAVANEDGNDVAILLNDKSGNFPTPVPITLSNSYFWQGAAVLDLDKDGNQDIIMPLYSPGVVAVLRGIGDGTFQLEQDSAIGTDYAEALAVADFNGDGNLDVAVTLDQSNEQNIAIALGNGDGTFGTVSTPFSLIASSLQDPNLDWAYAEMIQAMDVDGDGKIDLVYTNTEFSTVGVLFGKGDGTFYDPVEYPVGGYDWSLVAADVNSDKVPDIAASGDDFPGVTVLLNNNGSATQANYTLAPDVTTATVTAGNPATFNLTITPTRHYNGTITFACPAGLDATMTCTFAPPTVTLDGLNPITVKLTIATKAPSVPSMRAAIDLPRNSRPGSSSMLLASLSGMGVFAMFLAGSLGKKRDRWSVLIALTLAMSLFFVGCGGSSNHTTTITKSNTTSAVTTSAATVLVGQTVTFSAAVMGAGQVGTPSGTVTFLDGTTTLGTGTLSSGAATYQTKTLAAGVHSITISYGGDSNFNSSTSSALSQTVQNPGTPVGPYQVTVTGTGTTGSNGAGAPIQSIPLTVTVQ